MWRLWFYSKEKMFKVLEFTRAESSFTFERKPGGSGQKVRVDEMAKSQESKSIKVKTKAKNSK